MPLVHLYIPPDNIIKTIFDAYMEYRSRPVAWYRLGLPCQVWTLDFLKFVKNYFIHTAYHTFPKIVNFFFFFFSFFTNVAINNKRNILNFGHIIEAITKNRTWKFLIYKKIQTSPPVLCKELSFLFYCDDDSPSLPPVIFISFCLYFKRMCICSRSAHF